MSEKKPSKVHAVITPHTHCKVCGKAIPEGQIYCSKACHDRDEGARRRERRTMWIFYAIFFVVMIGMFLYIYVIR
ncbi:MAG: DUF2116 family Zn-ribbon domain-containing protein [Nitrososphaerota archaeon]|jgi:predicted nucleic acid-binding Zn ribbon protein|nr:DUF2116 family Zn-ribbon domain-containing protein [Nitrososphaerota archaeon]MDG6935936.1 DUF2116 family Zn-ribbon domain-containing protein [Nitrososphaerota archaeon]MDG7034978.1 DUF2116 family Zn-ribbon domain-containing protein [Nitrososphaerota archaeon]MDG7039676.1 DUF2116 family Zn-ribbon domain-containing protein [Nitrososphaerota archaeon]MDG7046177.1 DUF2116 family Zn-ribbon domain-containing protein [Nitrososphaerota archaeon]